MSAGFSPILPQSPHWLGRLGRLPDRWRRAALVGAFALLGLAATLPANCRKPDGSASEENLMCSRSAPH